MSEILTEIHRNGILPSVSLQQLDDAAPTVRALYKGGIRAAEVIFRTSADADLLSAMKQACPGMILGAGGISSEREAQAALDAGARFLVLSGVHQNLVQFGQTQNVPVIPAISDPDKLAEAADLGITLVKWFPANHLGGIDKINVLAKKYPQMKFLPAGISQNHLNAYITNPAVSAVSLSWMIDPEAMATENYAEITRLTKQIMENMISVHLAHAGLNGTKEDAKDTAEQFARLVFSTVKETPISYFGSPLVEIMKEGCWKGTKGHIALGVSSTERAMHYYKTLGYEFDEASIQRRKDGDAWLAYFTQEINGFRVHLVSKAD